ncbi:MAG: helix-turn-helix domain-containing protein [Clostridium sp.]|nr:helix-turn-helix domain-containing protein [Clostridium sp.]MCM1444173.1 helix-turn-helix domain-containing protein [Candidatus Amulumruptor caecigallinarius]
MRNTNRAICKIFSKNLRYYMLLTGTSRNDICKELEIKYSTLSNWLSCYNYASEDNIKQLADYFGISRSQLTEDNDKEHLEIDTKSKKRRELIKISAELSDEDLDILLSMVKNFLKRK